MPDNERPTESITDPQLPSEEAVNDPGDGFSSYSPSQYPPEDGHELIEILPDDFNFDTIKRISIETMIATCRNWATRQILGNTHPSKLTEQLEAIQRGEIFHLILPDGRRVYGKAPDFWPLHLDGTATEFHHHVRKTEALGTMEGRVVTLIIQQLAEVEGMWERMNRIEISEPPASDTINHAGTFIETLLGNPPEVHRKDKNPTQYGLPPTKSMKDYLNGRESQPKYQATVTSFVIVSLMPSSMAADAPAEIVHQIVTHSPFVAEGGQLYERSGKIAQRHVAFLNGLKHAQGLHLWPIQGKPGRRQDRRNQELEAALTRYAAGEITKSELVEQETACEEARRGHPLPPSEKREFKKKIRRLADRRKSS